MGFLQTIGAGRRLMSKFNELLVETQRPLQQSLAGLIPGSRRVQVGSNIDPTIGIDAVYADLNHGLELASEMLHGMGHRRVELILPTGPGPDMHMAHFLALAKKNKSLQPLSGMLEEEWGSQTGGEKRAKYWLQRRNRPTAFICSPIHAEGLIKDGLARIQLAVLFHELPQGSDGAFHR